MVKYLLISCSQGYFGKLPCCLMADYPPSVYTLLRTSKPRLIPS
ncbi:MAG: hypothetical protein AB1397_05335 [bacterium]